MDPYSRSRAGDPQPPTLHSRIGQMVRCSIRLEMVIETGSTTFGPSLPAPTPPFLQASSPLS